MPITLFLAAPRILSEFHILAGGVGRTALEAMHAEIRRCLPLEAAAKHDIDLKSSYFFGDRWKDVHVGKAARCRTIFVNYAYVGSAGHTGRYCHFACRCGRIHSRPPNHGMNLPSVALSSIILEIFVRPRRLRIQGCADLPSLVTPRSGRCSSASLD
jgi:hypothetical protein